MSYDQLKLENQLCFPLYASSRIITKLYKPFLDPMGLTYTQYVALLVLWEKDSLSVKELGSLLYLDSGTLTPMLKKMEDQGIVARVRGQEDERVVHIKLTEKGWKMRDTAAEIPGKMAGCLDMTMPEAMELKRLLGLILAKECRVE